jgi:GTP-binding protein
VADIPGLLEKAHDNYGLGHTFLRHIERCDHLLYVLDGTQPLLDQLKVLENELNLYNDGLSRKAKMVVVNKVDIEGVEEKIRQLNGCISLPIIPISALYRWNIQHLKYFIFDLYSNHYNSDNKIEFKK